MQIERFAKRKIQLTEQEQKIVDEAYAIIQTIYDEMGSFDCLKNIDVYETMEEEEIETLTNSLAQFRRLLPNLYILKERH